ncbi:MAG TPA: PEP/pyruvate-binding domain-containing protein, partial [Anaerolineales bacterium]|nr:PEP/pyruvate-binding domain-containing protein [Anaerolineales bacterium]
MFILPFTSPDVRLETAGGKGANLARLTRAGFQVPRGFIISTDAYRAFVEANRWLSMIESSVDIVSAEDASGLEKISGQIRAAFSVGKIPDEIESVIREAYGNLPHPNPSPSGRGMIEGPGEVIPVAVRSSATAEDLPDLSFAGQQETYLNIFGIDDVLKAVINCWSSLWTARAIGYRMRNHIPQNEVALAVVLQEMIQSDASGVLFTANPLTGLLSESVIDATFGLGEALVSGQVEPDHYVVDIFNRRIVEKKLGAKKISTRGVSGGGVETIDEDASERQALSDDEILQLADLGEQIQKEYGSPQDIEWAFADGKLYLLQARAITSLYPVPEISFDPLKVWFSFGAVQGLLQPITPLGQDSIRLVLAGAAGLFGFRLDHESIDFIRVAGERLWVQLDGIVRNPIGARAYKTILPLVEPSSANILTQLAKDPRLKAGSGVVRFSTIGRILRFLLPLIPRFAHTMHNPEKARDEFQGHLARLSGMAHLPREGDMYERLAKCVVLLRDDSTIRAFEFVMPRFLPIFAPSVASLGLLTKLAEQNNESDHGVAPLVLEVTRGLPRNVTTEMDLALWDTAKAIRADKDSLELFTTSDAPTLARRYLEGTLTSAAQESITRFMDLYGMRGVGEIDLGQPRWRESPEPIMQNLQSYLKITDELAPDVLFERGAQRAEEAIDTLAKTASQQSGGWLKEKLVRGAARRVRALMGAREAPKFYAIRVMGVVRTELLAIGEELAKAGVIENRDDLVFLHIRELDALAHREQGDWKALIAERHSRFRREANRKQIPRVLVSDGRAFYEGLGAETDTGDMITGSPVSPGV